MEGRLIYFWAKKKVLIALSTLETFVRFWGVHKPFCYLSLWRGRRGSNPRPLP